MRWGRRRDADLRSRVQVLESRHRLAVSALEAFQARFIELARDLLSIGDITELMTRLEAIRTVLSDGEVTR
jgi:hypothetical protein